MAAWSDTFICTVYTAGISSFVIEAAPKTPWFPPGWLSGNYVVYAYERMRLNLTPPGSMRRLFEPRYRHPRPLHPLAPTRLQRLLKQILVYTHWASKPNTSSNPRVVRTQYRFKLMKCRKRATVTDLTDSPFCGRLQLVNLMRIYVISIGTKERVNIKK